jgi:hypothetical protein
VKASRVGWLDVYLPFLYKIKLCIIGFRHKSREATHGLLPSGYPPKERLKAQGIQHKAKTIKETYIVLTPCTLRLVPLFTLLWSIEVSAVRGRNTFSKLLTIWGGHWYGAGK